MTAAFITGLAGERLTDEEAAFLAAARPCGIILFARNCRAQGQIRTLAADARAAAGGDGLLVLIDEEGGRVQRLRPPAGRLLPPAAAYGALYEAAPGDACRAARDVARLLAADLAALGINTVCAPVLDVPVPGAHEIIGDRAYGRTPEQVAALGRAAAEGFAAGGLLPVMKHIPGHGRAACDSHHALPVVTATHAELSAADFAPFKALAHFPAAVAAMTAHVVYQAIDGRPASVSPAVIGGVIRGEIGFDGLLMSDDIGMHALSGPLAARTEAAVAAGCDVVLHCNGKLNEMREVAGSAPPLAGAALRRYETALAAAAAPAKPFDALAAEAVLGRLLADHARRRESV